MFYVYLEMLSRAGVPKLKIGMCSLHSDFEGRVTKFTPSRSTRPWSSLKHWILNPALPCFSGVRAISPCMIPPCVLHGYMAKGVVYHTWLYYTWSYGP